MPPVKVTNSIDAHVGRMIRSHRRLARMSQAALGEHLGVSFQQVQKYELGINRVSAARLAALAAIFGVPVTTFFDGAPLGTISMAEIENGSAYFPTSFEGVELSRAFAGISDLELRQAIIELAEAIAGGSDRAARRSAKRK